MKVQTKIALLLVVVVAIFIAGLWGFRVYDRSKFRGITQQRVSERNRAFDAFLEKHGEPLKTLADEDSNLDQMVQAIESNDHHWFNENVNGPRLASFKAHAAWIYGPDATLRYSTDTALEAASSAPDPARSFRATFRQKSLAHFFVKIGGDIMRFGVRRFMAQRNLRVHLRGTAFSSWAVCGISRPWTKCRFFRGPRFGSRPRTKAPRKTQRRREWADRLLATVAQLGWTSRSRTSSSAMRCPRWSS